MTKQKDLNKKISYPRFYLKLFLKGKVVNSLATKKKQRILYRIRLFNTRIKADRAFLRFQYDRNHNNAGSYISLKELEHAYRCFDEIIEEFI